MNQHLLHEVEMAGFVLDDMVLYLDTHPTDMEALAYYQTARANYEQAVANYTDQVGPLFMYDACGNSQFSWLTESWPWEGGCN
jgi:spore coat protein JB